MWAKAAKFLISNSLLLSLDGILIVIFGSWLYGIQINFELTIAAFLSVFSVYNLNRVTDKDEDSINRPETTTKSTKYYVIPSIIAMATSLVLGSLKGGFALLILAVPILIGVCYSVKISNRLPRLKEVIGAKSFVVALSWSMIGAFLPLSLKVINLETVTLVFAYIFVQVMVNTILFDALDNKGDSVAKIKTVPILLGPKKTRTFLLLVNSSLFFWLFFCLFEGLFTKSIIALAFGIGYNYAIIWRFSKQGYRKISTEIIIDGQWFFIVPLMKLILK